MPLLSVCNPGGTKTPQNSAVATPCATPKGLKAMARIAELVNEATINQDQAALKKLVSH